MAVKGRTMTIGERIDHAKEKLKGKANQVAGDIKDDLAQKMKGRMQETKADLKETATDIKESFKDR